VQPVTEPVTDVGTNDAGLTSSGRQKLISATVQIFGLFNDGGDLVPGYTGSGTIISSSGLILTNAHVASPASQGDSANEPDALGIAIVLQEDKPAVPSYLAQVLAVDGFLDLAVIQIVSSIDGRPVDANSLNLPYVELGDSDSVRVGDELDIFGFPGIGGNTITFTQGAVSGFSSEDQLGDRAWIKTDATISGGNSGGLAADNNGRIIGVPTIASSGAEGVTEITDCRQIQDTNGDGSVDQNDSCIPIGGFLNGIRPVKLALPLLEAAQAGKQYVSPFNQGGGGTATEPGSGNENASNFAWVDTSNSSQDECDYQGDVINSYSGSFLCIATIFDYVGMTNGQLLVEYWYLNDEKFAEYSYVWEFDESGTFATWLPNDGNPMPNGTYKLELYAGDNLILMGTSPNVEVSGSSGATQPQNNQSSEDTVTVYGQVYDAATNKPINGAYVFVLNPGITYDEWANANYPDKDISTYLQTGSDGRYKITDIPRNTEFTLVFSAQGYYDSYADNLSAGDNDPVESEINVGLTGQ
jgi:S1-C subfamily serine protease